MAEICIIESDKIVNGSNLMKGNTDLVEWNSDLSKLENGQFMFNGCTNLTSFSSDLSSLMNGLSMFSNCSNLESFSSDLSSLKGGYSMFWGCINLTSFSSDLSSLKDGTSMFSSCKLDAPSVKNKALTINKTVTNNPRFDIGVDSNLANNEQVKKDLVLIKHKGWDLWINGSNMTTDYTLPKYAGCTTIDEVEAKDANYLSNDIVGGVWSEHLPDLTNGSTFFQYRGTLTSFTGDLSSLTDGTDMFYSCLKLATFTSNLSNLRHGYRMFYNCQKIETFNYKLPSLWNSSKMFLGCDNLTTFTSDMPILENGEGMFNHADNLTTFTANMPSLTNGSMMFVSCTNLTSFTSDLSSLTNGSHMFTDCKLDTDSVQNIADTINTVTNKPSIHIGIGNTTPNEQEKAAFNTIASKGWSVYVNGSSTSNKWNPTSITPENGEEITTPIPFYAKPVPAIEETASYVDSESNYYNILGAQFIYGDDLSTYGMFTCEADAAANMRLTKIER